MQEMEAGMSQKVFPVRPEWKADTWIDAERYQQMYRRSLDDPESFWREHGKRLDWIRPYTRVKDTSFTSSDLHVRWYEDGTLNACANCLDRHLAQRAEQAAILWQ